MTTIYQLELAWLSKPATRRNKELLDIYGRSPNNRTTTHQHTESTKMKTTAVLLAFAISMIAIENLPNDLANVLGLALIITMLAVVIGALVALGKASR